MTDTPALLDLVLDDVIASVQFNRSVLLQAAMQGHGDVLCYLLQRVSSTNSSGGSSSGRDPPSSLPDQPHPELVTALSEAFLGAAEQGHPHCLLLLKTSSAPFMDFDGLIHARNKQDKTALMVAAEAGRDDCVEMLLQHSPGTQVAAVSKHGDTALILAAWKGHAGCVSKLLHHTPQTQVAAADKGGWTALMLATQGDHPQCVSQLLQHIPLTQAAAREKECGNTVLMVAAWRGYAQCMELLLQHNPEAQVAAAADGGATALSCAVFSNHPACVALLLTHSPSSQIAAQNAAGRSVLERAAYLGRPQCLDLLLAHDPQPQHLDAAWLAALQEWDETHEHTSPHTQCLERLHAKGALLPVSAQEADRARNRRFIQDFGSRALVADRANEAIVGLALSARGRKRKAGQREAE